MCFSALAGWGPGVFTDYDYWFIIPVVASHVGAVAGAWAYYLAVMNNWGSFDNKDEETPQDRDKLGTVGDESQYLQVLVQNYSKEYIDIVFIVWPRLPATSDIPTSSEPRIYQHKTTYSR